MKSSKICIFSVIFFLAIQFVYASDYINKNYKIEKHQHSESSYQHAYCSMHNGIEEFENSDKTRVDCLTDTHAIEFDFANKWAESIGQALHYSYMTGKRAKVVLIIENQKKQMSYFKRVYNLSKIYDFDVEYITGEILNLKNNQCPYFDCKCKKL